jgi:hypothetical protein
VRREIDNPIIKEKSQEPSLSFQEKLAEYHRPFWARQKPEQEQRSGEQS